MALTNMTNYFCLFCSTAKLLLVSLRRRRKEEEADLATHANAQLHKSQRESYTEQFLTKRRKFSAALLRRLLQPSYFHHLDSSGSRLDQFWDHCTVIHPTGTSAVLLGQSLEGQHIFSKGTFLKEASRSRRCLAISVCGG